MGRFKWLEVDKTGEKPEKPDSGAPKKEADANPEAASAPRPGQGEMSKFGRTAESDGVIYDSQHFKREGFASYEAGDFERALLNFSKCLSENNKDEEAWIYQIISQIQSAKYEDALTWAKRAFEFFNYSADIQSLYALCLLLNKKGEDAVAYSDGAIAKKKPSYYVWMARAEIILGTGTLNSSMVCFKNASAFKVVSGAKNMDFEMAMAFFRAKKYARALSYFKKAIQSGICNTFIYEKIGFVNEQLEFYEDSEFYYRLALDLNASYRPALEGFARVRDHNTAFSKIFNWISKLFKMGGQPKDDPEA